MTPRQRPGKIPRKTRAAMPVFFCFGVVGGGLFVAVVPLIRGIPPKGGGGFVFESLPRRGSPPPASLSGMKPAPLRRSPRRREVCRRCPLLRRIPPDKGEGVLFVRGSPPASLSGRKPPLIPPYQGGKKLSPFGVALLPYREWNPPLKPPLIREVRRRCPPDKGDTPEGGRGFCCCPPDKGDTPEGGRGFGF